MAMGLARLVSADPLFFTYSVAGSVRRSGREGWGYGIRKAAVHGQCQRPLLALHVPTVRPGSGPRRRSLKRTVRAQRAPLHHHSPQCF
jgi:hypothetical protein